MEPHAWERLADLYGPLPYRRCRLSALTADVVQEVFRAVAEGSMSPGR